MIALLVDWANYAPGWQEPRVEEMSGEDNGSDRSDPGPRVGSPRADPPQGERHEEKPSSVSIMSSVSSSSGLGFELI